jgi:uncharacterized protein (DUF1778 family)
MADLTDRSGVRKAAAGRGSTINLRIEAETRALIDTAANALGKTRTEFMIETARRRAIDVLVDQRLFVLTPERHDAFTQALDNPRPAGARLRALMKRRPLWET